MSEMTESITLGEALPKEMARVRDEVLPIYDSFPTGSWAARAMHRDLDAAAKAMAEGDVVAMLRVYQSLCGYDV